jgi:hypothetical protein
MDSRDHAAAQQRRALDFMLNVLSLHDAREEAHRGARLYAFMSVAHGLINDYQQLLRHISELEHALAPDDSELEALARESEARAARVTERGADDI